MSIKYSAQLTQLAGETGLSVDHQTGSLFGGKGGYSVLLTQIGGNYQFALSVAVCQNGGLPDAKALKLAVKESKALVSCTVRGYKATYVVRSAMSKAKTHENMVQALDSLTRFLRFNGFQNCCQSCGALGETEAYSVAGADALLCRECFAAGSSAADLKAQAQSRKGENVLGGLVGAFLGSLLGAAMIVLLGQLGYVASLSGLVMGVCTVKGYELLGGRLTKKGVVISVVLMLLMVYVGHRLDWALLVASEFDAGLVESFQAIPYLYSEGIFEGYISGLLIVYVFTALGAVPAITRQLRERDTKTSARKMTANF